MITKKEIEILKSKRKYDLIVDDWRFQFEEQQGYRVSRMIDGSIVRIYGKHLSITSFTVMCYVLLEAYGPRGERMDVFEVGLKMETEGEE